jgi:hypothetical protein
MTPFDAATSADTTFAPLTVSSPLFWVTFTEKPRFMSGGGQLELKLVHA